MTAFFRQAWTNSRVSWPPVVSGVEEGHVRRHEEVHAAGDEVEVYVLAPERLTVDVHDEILLAVDLEMTALEMGDEFSNSR